MRGFVDIRITALKVWLIGPHKPASIPHQMPAPVEAAVLESHRVHHSSAPRRFVYRPSKRGVVPVPLETGRSEVGRVGSHSYSPLDAFFSARIMNRLVCFA